MSAAAVFLGETLDASRQQPRTSRPQEAKRLVDQDAAIILDVSKQPKGQKIKVAVRANPNDLAGWLTVVARGKDVTTYCT